MGTIKTIIFHVPKVKENMYLYHMQNLFCLYIFILRCNYFSEVNSFG